MITATNRNLRQEVNAKKFRSETTEPTEGHHGSMQISADAPFRETRDRFLSAFERAYLVDLVQKSQGNIAAASRQAGIDRAYLYRMLWKHGLK